MTKVSNKFNDSGIKMYKLLTLLFQGETDFKDVIQIFMDGGETSANKANVNICKYLNSLKVFGIRVEKVRDKYRAYNLPYAYSFTKEELDAIKKFKACAATVLKGKAKKEFDNFMRALEIRFDDATQKIFFESQFEGEVDFSFFYKDTKDKLELAEKYISDNQNLDIIYIGHAGKEKRVSGRPLDIAFTRRYASLRIYNSKEARLYDIPITAIRSAVQSPQKSTTIVSDTAPVVFKLSGRLAKNYRLRDNEYSRGVDPFDGRLIVVNKNEDIDILLHRLMRYGTNCEICTPKAVRDEMKSLIAQTIENYS